MPDTPPDNPAADAQGTNHPPIVLFDGLCGLCDGSVGLLLALDRRRRLRFAPLQSEAGRWLRDHAGVPEDADTMVLIDRGQAHVRSDAIAGICRLLGPPWSAAAALRLLPRPLRDAAYDLVARWRRRLAPRRDACRQPTDALAGRLLTSRAQARAALND